VAFGLDFEGLDGILAAALDDPAPQAARPDPLALRPRRVAGLDMEGLDGILPAAPRVTSAGRPDPEARPPTPPRRIRRPSTSPPKPSEFAGVDALLRATLSESFPEAPVAHELSRLLDPDLPAPAGWSTPLRRDMPPPFTPPAVAAEAPRAPDPEVTSVGPAPMAPRPARRPALDPAASARRQDDLRRVASAPAAPGPLDATPSAARAAAGPASAVEAAAVTAPQVDLPAAPVQANLPTPETRASGAGPEVRGHAPALAAPPEITAVRPVPQAILQAAWPPPREAPAAPMAVEGHGRATGLGEAPLAAPTAATATWLFGDATPAAGLPRAPAAVPVPAAALRGPPLSQDSLRTPPATPVARPTPAAAPETPQASLQSPPAPAGARPTPTTPAATPRAPQTALQAPPPPAVERPTPTPTTAPRVPQVSLQAPPPALAPPTLAPTATPRAPQPALQTPPPLEHARVQAPQATLQAPPLTPPALRSPTPTATPRAPSAWGEAPARPPPLPVPKVQHPFVAAQAQRQRAGLTVAAVAVAAVALALLPALLGPRPLELGLSWSWGGARSAAAPEARPGSVVVRPGSGPAAAAALDAQLSAVLPCPGGMLVVGHGDGGAAEDASYRAGLGLARAVEERLLAGGVPQAAITTVSVGGRAPLADDATPEGRRLNRRVEVTCHAEP
jgi:hypothetical protein